MHSNNEWTIASVVMNCRSEDGQYSNTEAARVETHSTCPLLEMLFTVLAKLTRSCTSSDRETSWGFCCLPQWRKKGKDSCSCKSATPIASIASFRSRTLITWSHSHARVTPTPVHHVWSMNATLLIAVRDYSSTVCDIQKIAGILTERTAAVSSLEHSK